MFLVFFTLALNDLLPSSRNCDVVIKVVRKGECSANTKSFACSILHLYVIIREIQPSPSYNLLVFCSATAVMKSPSAAEILDFSAQVLSVSS